MNSVPIEIAQLGMGVDDYISIAKNVKRVLSMSRNLCQRILDRATSDLSKDVTVIATRLPMAMANDREFFREAGLPYGPGVPKQGCFKISVADYLLRNLDKINF